LLAKGALQAGAVDPLSKPSDRACERYRQWRIYLHASMVTEFNILNKRSKAYNNASTFVATNQRNLGS
jgi:hypothetical protein